MPLNLTDIHALVIDMDGVLWRGDQPLPGLNAFFDFLQSRDIPFMLATNNATKTPDQYLEKLGRFNVAVARHQIMTSALATASYLKQTYPAGTPVYVVGQAGLREAIRAAGFVLVDNLNQPAHIVAAGLDRELSYDKLAWAALHIQRGADFVGSNGDLTFPTEQGFAPGAGAILKLIEASTNTAPVVVGKPEPLMFQAALRQMGASAGHTAMLGDRLETDVLGGQRAGLKTILVETGVDNLSTIAQKGIQPDAVFSGLEALLAAWSA